ncbi:MAG: hypothetical protein M1816_007875 [Peltula sp. TS41687]|nr:MAG: hypothetical protein M1816_007875 [Peltula sp. TS41687]
MANKYDTPPPTYPQGVYTPQHQDAGPYPPPQPANADYYGNPAMTASPHYAHVQPAQPAYQAPQQDYYGQQPPQQPGQGMYYQQPPPGAAPGHFAGGQSGRRGNDGLCAAVLGALACCCCLDFIF